MVTVSIFQNRVHSETIERRRFQRLRKAVQAELRVRSNTTPIRTVTADISMRGCYIEMRFTLDVGAALEVNLWLGQEKLSIEGKVVTQHSHFGNGIEFGNMSEDARKKLRAFLDF